MLFTPSKLSAFNFLLIIALFASAPTWAAPTPTPAPYLVTNIEDGSRFLCLVKGPTNLLLSAQQGFVGKVLVYQTELNKIAKEIDKLKKEIAKLLPKKESGAIAQRKRLEANVLRLEEITASVIACRDRIPVADVKCATAPNGTVCDDKNPCSGPDRCQNGSCVSSGLIDDTALHCSFGKCQKEVKQCVRGHFIACVDQAAGSELCNNIDDDCNGSTDESSVCVYTPTPTPTNTPTNTPTATATNTPTNTPVAPTATATNTPTNTPVVPTATATNTPTNTSVPPTATATNTPTNTSVPPTATATNTPTNTPVVPTATATNTPTP